MYKQTGPRQQVTSFKATMPDFNSYDLKTLVAAYNELAKELTQVYGVFTADRSRFKNKAAAVNAAETLWTNVHYLNVKGTKVTEDTEVMNAAEAEAITTETPKRKRGTKKSAKKAKAEEPTDLPTKPATVKAKKVVAEKAVAAGPRGRAPKYADDMVVYKLKTDEEAKRHKYWALYDGEPTVKETIDRYLAAGASLSIARLQLSYESLTGFIEVR